MISAFLMLGAGLAWLVLDARAELEVVAHEFRPSTQECTPSSPVLLSSPRTSIELAGEMLFASNDALRMRVCGSGLLSFLARGSALGGGGANLVVASGAKNLWEGYVIDEAAFDILVTEPGWLTLAFVNDAIESTSDRNLWISRLTYVPFGAM